MIYKVDVAINQDLKALFLKSSVDSKFLFYWIGQNASNIALLGNGSTVKGISIVDLKNLPLLLPIKSEQIAIAQVLSDMDTELIALEQRRDKTKLLKQAMMQELLTGRIRLV